MPIEYCDRSIFDSPARAIANPVNTVGTSGAGLARSFASRYPAAQRHYVAACRGQGLAIGSILCIPTPDDRIMVCVPTKEHWRNPSRLEWIEAGLEAAARALDASEIADLALPRLGCGFGGLAWPDVHRQIVARLGGRRERIVVHGTAPATRSAAP